MNLFNNKKRDIGTFIEMQNESVLNASIPQNIIEEIKNYDIFDFISRISGLHLIPQNQNKANYFDVLISQLLELPRESFPSNIKMSAGRFSKLLKQICNSRLSLAIDPSENVFVQNMTFGGNYLVFNGIEWHPAYTLQSLEKILFEYSNDFPELYLEKMRSVFTYFLDTTDFVAKSVCADFQNAVNDESSTIYIPDSSTIEYNSDLVKIDSIQFDQFFNDFNTESFFAYFGMPAKRRINDVAFYPCPFLRDDGSDEIIVLNITLVPNFIFTYALTLAEELGIRQAVVNRFNDYCWKTCREDLEALGHSLLDHREYNITLYDEQYYKEQLFSASGSEVLCAVFCCDDAADYSAVHSRGDYPDTIHEELLWKRLPYLSERLKTAGIPSDSVYLLLFINAYGREIRIHLDKNVLSSYPIVMLAPFDLHCISINESKEKDFLPRYIRAKGRLHSTSPSPFSELNAIEDYVSNDYSFYMSDDYNMGENTVFFGGGDAVDYIKRALIREDRKVINSYKRGYLAEVIRDDNSVYFEAVRLSDDIHIAICLDELVIWFNACGLASRDSAEIMDVIIDTVAYWFTQLGEAISGLGLAYRVYNFEFEFSGEEDTCTDVTGALGLITGIGVFRNSIIVRFSESMFRQLDFENNTAEKAMMEVLFSCMLENCFQGSCFSETFNSAFSNPLKKKIVPLDYGTWPYYKPLQYVTDRPRISNESVNLLLDDVGAYILKEHGGIYGILPEEESQLVPSAVVDYLYCQLKAKVAEISTDDLIEKAYTDLEAAVFNISVHGAGYKSDVLCYPEKKEDLLKTYQDCNNASMAIMFLLEYAAARPSVGEKKITQRNYEYLLAICYMIIDWAYKGDLYHYRIIKAPVKLLQSRRIGLRQEQFEQIAELGIVFRQDLMLYSPSERRNELLYYEIQDELQGLDAAFSSERGYTYGAFMQVLEHVRAYGETLGGEIFVSSRKRITDYLSNHGIDRLIAEKVIDDITIGEREDFLTPPPGFRKEDVYPWRFNRNFSISRRPMICRGENLIWGNRQLSYMEKYLSNLILTGKYKTESRKMNALMGKIKDRQGKNYNRYVAELLEGLNRFEIDTGVKKVKGNKISEKGKDLGDIDILLIDHTERRIYVAEVKNFTIARNPYEIQQEYLSLFEDSADHRSFYTKHLKRVQWIYGHLLDACSAYNLDANVPWTVVELFIVRDPVISNLLYKKNINLLSESELTLQRILSIKPQLYRKPVIPSTLQPMRPGKPAGGEQG